MERKGNLKWEDQLWCKKNCPSLDEAKKKCRLFEDFLMKVIVEKEAKFMKDSECLHLLDFQDEDLFLDICAGGNKRFILF